MILVTDILNSINCEIPLFSHGEGYIDEFLERSSFDEEGIVQRGRMFDQVSNEIMEFLHRRFPTLGRQNHLICCDLQISHLREKIEAIDCAYEYYQSIMAQYAQ